ncbi:MAG: N-acyl-L-homoserine lactone synthetase, partial [Proteobacteria bacterium]|nr:N-acyl-L-homoserine lactone synthetase [Pseudomonadota bacterium]
KIGEIKEYAYANNNPALAMRLDLRTMKENYANTYRNVLKKNNLYHFFFTAKSNSIILEDQSFSIEKRLLENLKYLYGFRT